MNSPSIRVLRDALLDWMPREPAAVVKRFCSSLTTPSCGKIAEKSIANTFGGGAAYRFRDRFLALGLDPDPAFFERCVRAMKRWQEALLHRAVWLGLPGGSTDNKDY